MSTSQLYLITTLEGLTPQIGRLVSMMNYVRHTTLESVQGCTVDELDYRMDATSNSIGSLLLHAAAVEYAYQRETFDNRELTEEELELWGAALDLGERGRHIHGNPLTYYLEAMQEVRENTIRQLQLREDEWLEQTTSFWYNKPANHYFKWFHVFEDEINHRGQIRWIRKRIPISQT